jgi:Zn-dependent protease with chaperone function
VFELLGISLLFAALLTFNSFASLVSTVLWRLMAGVTKGSSASSRARLLFTLRALPAGLAVFCAAALLLPSYLAYEPRHTNESVSLKLGLLAFFSAIGICVALGRGLATWRATTRLTADWLKHAQRITVSGVNISTYRIQHAFPVVAIVGIVRPRLFVASQILDALSVDELAGAVAHENAHIAAHDNLKRGLLRACRDALLIIPCGRLLDHAWSQASEEAADEQAAFGGASVALDLASALVKIARMIPVGARPAMPAGVLLLGDGEKVGVRDRVRRLVQLANEKRDLPPSAIVSGSAIWIPIALTIIIVILAATKPHVLASVHSLIEHAVYLLA